MRKPVAIGLGLLAFVLLVSTIVLSSKYRQQSDLYAQSRQAEEAVRTQFDSALESIAEIQDSLNAIAPEDAELGDLAGNRELDSQVTETQKDRMLNTIADLRTSIEKTGTKIRDLETSLEGSQAQVEGLRRVIANLKRSVEEKEFAIELLMARVDTLQVRVAGLQNDVARGQETIAMQEAVIEDKRREIGTIEYVVGTKNQLKEKGIIVEKGGFIGIGKSPSLTGTFEEGDFTVLNTDEVTEISVAGREPLVLSAQDKSSYELEPSGADHSTLRIIDPAEFRKVKYLVIMVN
jgi:hypothetical protein